MWEWIKTVVSGNSNNETDKSISKNEINDINKNSPVIEDLNEGQRKAVLNKNKNVLILAGAGSGKTKTLIQKILYLLSEQKANPSEIMAITFTRNAANEMIDRLILIKDPNYEKIIYNKKLKKKEKEIQRKKYIKKYPWLNAITVNTFHSVCYSILRTYGARVFDNKFKILLDRSYDDEIPSNRIAPESQLQIIHKTIIELSEDVDFLLKLKRYILDYYVDSYRKKMHLRGRIDFEKPYTTLNKEHVSSKSERDIADWLYRHNINYEYEPIIAPDEFQFRPDFYIPKANLYLEHVSDLSYPLKDKFSQMKKAGKTYVKIHEELTHNSKLFNDTLEDIISPHLNSQIKKNTALKFEEEFQGLEKYLNRFVLTILRVIDKIKVENKNFFEIFKNATKDDHERVRSFYEIMDPIYKEYTQYCKNRSYVDFNDLIILTIKLFKNNQKFQRMYQKKFKYILVDEFQDVNTLQVKLLKYFRHEKTQLFCVGDDWQSIYGWRGSEVEYIINFNEYFKNPDIVKLSINYRSHNAIVEASNELIKNNKFKVEKHIKSFKETGKKIYIYYAENEIEDGVKRTLEKVKQYLENGYDKKDILILTRTRKSDVYHSYRDALRKIGMRLMTMHQVKGLEAKVVFITGLTGGFWGFPNVRDADRIFQYIKKSDFELLMEEERRLFYVSLTRAKEDLFLITEMGNESKFIGELPEKCIDSENFLLFDLSKKDKRLCESCGNEIRIEFPYCPFCGKNLINKNEKKIKINKFLEEDRNIESSKNDEILYNNLKKWRRDLSNIYSFPAFCIFNNETLNDLVMRKPRNIEELKKVFGIGPNKINRYGKDILDIIDGKEIDVNKEKDFIVNKKSTHYDPKNLPNQGKFWSKREDEYLTEKWLDGVSNRKIAIQLGRSKSSIRARADKLNLHDLIDKKNTTNKDENKIDNKIQNNDSISIDKRGEKWTKSEEDILINDYFKGSTYIEIANKLGRSKGSIKARVEILKLYELLDNKAVNEEGKKNIEEELKILKNDVKKDIDPSQKNIIKNGDEIFISKEKWLELSKSHKKRDKKRRKEYRKDGGTF